jgi:hypothetical protein
MARTTLGGGGRGGGGARDHTRPGGGGCACAHTPLARKRSRIARARSGAWCGRPLARESCTCDAQHGSGRTWEPGPHRLPCGAHKAQRHHRNGVLAVVVNVQGPEGGGGGVGGRQGVARHKPQVAHPLWQNRNARAAAAVWGRDNQPPTATTGAATFAPIGQRKAPPTDIPVKAARAWRVQCSRRCTAGGGCTRAAPRAAGAKR